MSTLTASLFVVGLAGGAILGATLHNAPRTERISVPAPIVTVWVPPAPSPAVTVQATPAVEPAAEPAPMAAPPRAIAPVLWAQCVAPSMDRMPDAMCAWDDGFPAISADGTRIATKHIPDDGGRGFPGMHVHFLDARSGEHLSSIEILDPVDFLDSTADHEAIAEQQKLIAARVKKAQGALQGYRSLAPLGGGEALDGFKEEGVTPRPGAIYAEISAAGAARVIDPTTNTVIAQHMFGVPDPTPDDGVTMCGGWGLRTMYLWWDPATRVVLSSQTYRTGGCMCVDEDVQQVVRLP